MTTFKRRAIKTKSVKPKNFARKPAKTSVPKDFITDPSMEKSKTQVIPGEVPRFPRKVTKGTKKKTGRATFRRKKHPMK